MQSLFNLCLVQSQFAYTLIDTSQFAAANGKKLLLSLSLEDLKKRMVTDGDF